MPNTIHGRVWLVLGLVYATFFYWYTSFGGPLTDEEIAYYKERLFERGDGPDRASVWLEFMATDTGDDFVMINVMALRDTPQLVPGVKVGESSEAVMSRYTTPFLGRALASAAHPVLTGNAAARAIDLWGIEGAEAWTAGGLVRYRSRRDLLDHAIAIAESENPEIHDFKLAALEKTIAYPLDPWFHIGDPRLILALLLLIVGLATQNLTTRRSA